MNKLKAVISCPLDTYSGYGGRSRDFVKALIKAKPEWDVSILSQRWGNTKTGYLGDHNELDLIKRIIPGINNQPDIWIMITVPNEFRPIGRYNIGVTAGIETTVCHQDWVKGVNNMDVVFTSAEHAQKVFATSIYEIENNLKERTGTVKLNKPVEVLFEGVDTSKYRKVKSDPESPIVKSLDSIKESFCFLFVGHWLEGEFGQDRKDIGTTIERFLTTFRTQRNKPALILKTQSANSGILDQQNIIKKINEVRKLVGTNNLPNIYFIHGELSDKEINELYNHSKVKAMVSFTKGEGFGRPLLEFTTTGKPVIASNWSGHTDFLHKDYNILAGGKLTDVHPSAFMKDMIIKGAKWFSVDQAEASKAYKYVFKNYNKQLKSSAKQKNYTLKNFTVEKMEEKLKELLEKYTSDLPVKELINLPKK